MKKTITIIMIILAAFAVFAGGSKEKTDLTGVAYIKSKGTFILGLDDSFPPMGYRDENNEIVGFDIDVAKEVCKRLGVELVCQPIDWNAKEQELSLKQIDCIWNGFTITEERKQAMAFTDAYVENAQVVIVKNSSPVTKLSDLAGKKIGVQAGSSSAEAIADTPEFASIIGSTVEFKDNLTALMDLEIGGCDAVVMDLMVANFAIQESGKDFRILSETLAAEEYGVGFRTADKDLADKVTSLMKDMAKDGTMAEISTKWFGADITTIGK
ncbi:MAG: amino acid ABC transporter substrate-binding protein [Sphaerochaetaceae bacterium]|nr:amino acid ABC transporter substrate-binding protein [Sphaerochaetaceae bacterium]